MKEISETIEKTQAVNLSQSSFSSYMTKETQDYELKKIVKSPFIRSHKNFFDLLAENAGTGK